MNKDKLYQIKKHFWYLYPSKETAATLATVAAEVEAAASYSDYWSKRLNCNISYISPNTIFFPVEIDGKYMKIVSGEGIGWVFVPDWLKMYIDEEVT